MTIWSGWGVPTVLIAVLICGVVPIRGVALFDMAGLHRWPGLAFGLGLLAAVNWQVGQQLNGGPGRRLTDQAAGQTAGRRHSLFSIPMQWWSAPLTIAGVLPLLAAIAIPPGPGASHDGTVQS